MYVYMFFMGLCQLQQQQQQRQVNTYLNDENKI